MNYPNLAPSDVCGVVGIIDPDATAASTVTTAWIDAKRFIQYQAIIMAGTLGASATVDAKIEEATDGSGTGAQDLTGKAITQLVKASNDDDQAAINLRATELSSGFTHFRLSLTVGTATSDVGAVVLGLFPAQGPATDYDLASVVEVVA